jgi:hypothetical protein
MQVMSVGRVEPKHTDQVLPGDDKGVEVVFELGRCVEAHIASHHPSGDLPETLVSHYSQHSVGQ